MTKKIDNWFTHHPPTPEQARAYETIRAHAKRMAESLERLCPDGDEKKTATSHLRATVMWANASIACNPVVLDDDTVDAGDMCFCNRVTTDSIDHSDCFPGMEPKARLAQTMRVRPAADEDA